MSRTALTRTTARVKTGSMAEQIATRIASESRDGHELVEFALRVFRDPTMPFEDRRWAFEWLADRGAGKAMSTIEVHATTTHAVRLDLTDYTFEEMDEIERIQRAAQERKRIEQAKVIDVLPPPNSP